MMLKWVMPLNPTRSLRTFVQVLFKDVLNEKIRKFYTERGSDLITFRSRMAPELKQFKNFYPFDDVEISHSSTTEAGKKTEGAEAADGKTLEDKPNLLRNLYYSEQRKASSLVY
jgi:hypothetical protein